MIKISDPVPAVFLQDSTSDPKKPLGHFAVLGIVVAAALAVGLTGMFLFPDDLRGKVLETAINPVYNTFFRILGCIAGPMIFLSVAWGVYGIGDAATFGRIGRRMMIRYVGTTMIVCACCSVFYPLLGPGLSRDSNTLGKIGSIVELLLSVFPSTIIEPFATGNTLQIIFLAVVLGISLLYLGNKAISVARAIEQINMIVQYLMVIISIYDLSDYCQYDLVRQYKHNDFILEAACGTGTGAYHHRSGIPDHDFRSRESEDPGSDQKEYADISRGIDDGFVRCGIQPECIDL